MNLEFRGEAHARNLAHTKLEGVKIELPFKAVTVYETPKNRALGTLKRLGGREGISKGV